MRSIRLSLILCIVILLVASLATVSALAYREIQISLHDRNKSSEQFRQAKYQEDCRKEEETFNKSLLDDAQIIARSVTLKLELPDKQVGNPFILAGAFTGPGTPGGPFLTSFWTGFNTNTYLREKIWSWKGGTWKIQEIRISPEEEDPTRFIQVNTMSGDEWRSLSMGDHAFPFDQKLFISKTPSQKTPYVEAILDDVILNGSKMRIVRAKFHRFSINFTPPWSKGITKPAVPPASPEPDKKTQPPRPGTPDVSIYVQAARDLAPLDEALAKYKAERDEGFAFLDDQLENTLRTLRNRFLFIGGLTLLGAVFGGFLVVHWGLSPVKRLSDAVSQVSEKDFRLKVEAKELPSEIRPIAGGLSQTLELLQRAFEREKQAAADISHELRTPLAAMMTTLDVALRKPRPAEEYHEILEECRDAGTQMTQLVEHMLALARLDAGADHLRFREVNVGKIAEQCVSLVRPLAEARGLDLNVEHTGPTEIKADPDKIREVLTNLLHNAIEYNKPNGKIAVDVHRNNGSLRVQVSDTGIGIAPEAKEHIFERFFRADSSRHADTLHAGIGLALVKGYVDLMGGTITVDSEVGVGSRFQIDLPVTEKGHT